MLSIDLVQDKFRQDPQGHTTDRQTTGDPNIKTNFVVLARIVAHTAMDQPSRILVVKWF